MPPFAFPYLLELADAHLPHLLQALSLRLLELLHRYGDTPSSEAGTTSARRRVARQGQNQVESYFRATTTSYAPPPPPRLRRAPRLFVCAMRELSWQLDGDTNVSGPGPRLGVLSIPSAEPGQEPHTLATPACLTYTRRGEPAHLTPDVLRTLPAEARAFQVCLTHFMDHLPHTHVSECPGGGATYFGSAPFFHLATARDAITFDLNAKPSNDPNSVFVGTPVGVKKLCVEEYMRWVRAVQPSAFVQLADEHFSATNVNGKKTKAAVKRTAEWLDRCDEARGGEKNENNDDGDGDERKNIPMFACITGGACPASREESASAATAKGDSVFGFSIGGLGTGESPGAKRGALLDAALKPLPRNKPRHVAGVSSPLEVLDLINKGVDLVDNSFCHTVTTAGKALWFPVESGDDCFTEKKDHGASGDGKKDDGDTKSFGDGEGQKKKRRLDTASDDVSTSDADADAIDARLSNGTDAFTLNIWSLAYRMDGRPLVANCQCATCKNHTRSYLHHLAQCREMTLSVLLDVHNTFHYLTFFKAARTAIGNGTFDAFVEFHRKRADKTISYQR